VRGGHDRTGRAAESTWLRFSDQLWALEGFIARWGHVQLNKFQGVFRSSLWSEHPDRLDLLPSLRVIGTRPGSISVISTRPLEPGTRSSGCWCSAESLFA